MKKPSIIGLIVFISNTVVLGQTAPPSADLRFERQGREEKTFSQRALKELAPVQKLSTFEPEIQKKNTYNGWPIRELLEKIYGNLNGSIDTVVFHCEDGYRADIPLNDFKTKTALLAFEMTNGSPFVLKENTDKPVKLAPYYLVWDHPTAADAQRETYRWPYAVNKIEIINHETYYRPLTPSSPVAAEIQRGYTAFLKHCVSCHTVNAVGGRRGPPLNIFAQTKEADYLQKYMLDPKTINKNSQMPGLSKTIKDRSKLSRAIAAYLKKISS